MDPVRFTVPLPPLAQPRVKAVVRGKHAGVYTPTKNSKGESNGVEEYKEAIQLFARLAMGGRPPIAGPVRCDVVFVFPRGKSREWLKKRPGRLRHTVKPDRDNLDKCVLDALKGITWHDDCQACEGEIQKWYAAFGETPHAQVTISLLTD